MSSSHSSSDGSPRADTVSRDRDDRDGDSGKDRTSRGLTFQAKRRSSGRMTLTHGRMSIASARFQTSPGLESHAEASDSDDSADGSHHSETEGRAVAEEAAANGDNHAADASESTDSSNTPGYLRRFVMSEGLEEDPHLATPSIAVDTPFPRLASVKDPIEPRTMADLALKAMAQVAHDLHHLNTVDMLWLGTELMKLGLFERTEADEPDSEAASGGSDLLQVFPTPKEPGGTGPNLAATEDAQPQAISALGAVPGKRDARTAPRFRTLGKSLSSSMGFAEIRKRFSTHYGARDEDGLASGGGSHTAAAAVAAHGVGSGPTVANASSNTGHDTARSFRQDRRLTFGPQSMAHSSEIGRMADAFINSGRRVQLGFGLHFGWAIEGAVGSTLKIDVTYLSPHVNLAARLESLTKQYNIPLLMSSAFYKRLSLPVSSACRCIDRVTVKGSRKPISIYTYDLWDSLPVTERQRGAAAAPSSPCAESTPSTTKMEDQFRSRRALSETLEEPMEGRAPGSWGNVRTGDSAVSEEPVQSPRSHSPARARLPQTSHPTSPQKLIPLNVPRSRANGGLVGTTDGADGSRSSGSHYHLLRIRPVATNQSSSSQDSENGENASKSPRETVTPALTALQLGGSCARGVSNLAPLNYGHGPDFMLPMDYKLLFDQGIRDYVVGRWGAATRKLSICQKVLPEDTPARVILDFMASKTKEHAESIRVDGSPKQWRGYRALEEK